MFKLILNKNKANILAQIRSIYLTKLSFNQDENEYQQVPHYTQKSALYIKPPTVGADGKKEESVFPKIINPELDLNQIFKSKNIHTSSLNLNLSSRRFHLSLIDLQKDYFKMRELEVKLEQLNEEKNKISTNINNLVKSKTGAKKQIMESDEAKELIKAGNSIKTEINRLQEELSPLQEFVNIACLRLPNHLHYSSLYLHQQDLNNDLDTSIFIEDNYSPTNRRPVLFELTQNANKNSFNTELSWQNMLTDSIKIGDQVYEPHYKQRNWTFVHQSKQDAVLNNRYLVGTYAKVELCLSDYFYDKIQSFNQPESDFPTFEHIKPVNMFKSALVEGVGKNFNDKDIFNVVRFGNPIELYHLTGSSSLSALVLDFVRSKIKPVYLPWNVFTNGKTYSPKTGQVSSFDFLTLTSDNSSYLLDFNKESMSEQGLTDDFMKLIVNDGKLFLKNIKNELNEYLSKNDSVLSMNGSIDKIFVDYLKLFIHVYKDFTNIPIRFVCPKPFDLNVNESFSIKVEAYLPSEQTYATIGEVCLLNNYISSRLQIRIDNENENTKTPDHVNMIHCRLVNLNIFLQILIESYYNHEQNNFILPQFLKKYYLL